jgi:hypothetical protein
MELPHDFGRSEGPDFPEKILQQKNRLFRAGFVFYNSTLVLSEAEASVIRHQTSGILPIHTD